MATVTWIGGAPAIAQVGKFTVTADDAATTYSITIGNTIVSVLGTGASVAADAAAIVAACTACTAGQFLEITFSNPSGAIVQLTANTPGTPFTATSGASGGAGTIGSYTAITANQSGNDLDNLQNWSTSAGGYALPANGDTVVFSEQSSIPVYWNLGSLSAITPAAIIVTQGYTGQLGLPDTNIFGTPYPEYRATDIAFNSQASSKLTIGQGPGNGCGLQRWKLGSSSAWTITVFNTGSSTETGRQAVNIYSSSASNILTILGGSVELCGLQGQTFTASTITCGVSGQGASTPSLVLNVGCTLTTVTVGSGQLLLSAAATTLTVNGGLIYVYGSGAVTTLSVSNAQCYYQGTGTITTLNVRTGGYFDLGQAGPSVTITNTVNLFEGSIFNDVTYREASSTAFLLSGCLISDVTINLGPARTLTVT